MTPYSPAPGTVTRRVFDELLLHGTMSASELAENTGINPQKIYTHLKRSIKLGLVKTKRISGNRSSYIALSRNASIWDYAKKASI